ncbi:MAG: exonuclease SbcCD subunit D, partial [Victivallaceae bacterium]
MSEYEKLKLLHTSDWHLGATLCGRRRLDEAEAFVRWLLQLLEKEQINIVIIAGDVFDSVM